MFFKINEWKIEHGVSSEALADVCALWWWTQPYLTSYQSDREGRKAFPGYVGLREEHQMNRRSSVWAEQDSKVTQTCASGSKTTPGMLLYKAPHLTQVFTSNFVGNLAQQLDCHKFLIFSLTKIHLKWLKLIHLGSNPPVAWANHIAVSGRVLHCLTSIGTWSNQQQIRQLNSVLSLSEWNQSLSDWCYPEEVINKSSPTYKVSNILYQKLLNISSTKWHKSR